MADAVKGRRHTVVLFLRDGIELVVVTSGTVNRQSEEGLADDADNLFEFVLPHDLFHRVTLLRVSNLVIGTCDQKSSSNYGRRVSWLEDVAGELPGGEAVVRSVCVQRCDDPVAVSPRIGPKLVAFETLAFSVTDDVEPVPSPAFAIVRVSQVLLDKPWPGAGPVVGEKR